MLLGSTTTHENRIYKATLFKDYRGDAVGRKALTFLGK